MALGPAWEFLKAPVYESGVPGVKFAVQHGTEPEIEGSYDASLLSPLFDHGVEEMGNDLESNPEAKYEDYMDRYTHAGVTYRGDWPDLSQEDWDEASQKHIMMTPNEFLAQTMPLRERLKEPATEDVQEEWRKHQEYYLNLIRSKPEVIIGMPIIGPRHQSDDETEAGYYPKRMLGPNMRGEDGKLYRQHEGRHRMDALRRLGHGDTPVPVIDMRDG